MEELSPFQIQLLQRIANGERVSHMAVLIKGVAIKPHSLSMHIQRAREVLNATSTPHAVALALRGGLIK